MEDQKLEFDSGFYFGKGLFETILILKKPVFLKEHLLRLNKGLKQLNIQQFITEDFVLENIKGFENCAVKLMVSEKNIVFTKREIGYSTQDYEAGFRLKLSSLKRDPNSHMIYLKSFNYMDNIIEREMALKEGFKETIFFNNRGHLTEGSVSNIFLIMQDCILTPKVSCGLLAGVVRGVIIKEFGSHYNIIEEEITLNRMKQCKGILLTNSLMGIMWVNAFEEINFDKPALGEAIYRDYIKFL